jgi:hypothetical protein
MFERGFSLTGNVRATRVAIKRRFRLGGNGKELDGCGKTNSNHRVDEEYIYSSQDRAMAVAEGSCTRRLCPHGGPTCTDHPAAVRHPDASSLC